MVEPSRENRVQGLKRTRGPGTENKSLEPQPAGPGPDRFCGFTVVNLSHLLIQVKLSLDKEINVVYESGNLCLRDLLKVHYPERCPKG